MTHTTRAHLVAAIAAAAVLGLAGCDAARPISTLDAGSGTTCTRCHGDATRAESNELLRAAPPLTASGAPAGAHQRHLHDGPFRAALACSDCHVVPSLAQHPDGQVGVTFGALASARGAQPSYAAGSCASVYCHGATLNAGGTNVQPSWTGAALGCGSCHGYPPTSHAQSQTTCSSCHPGTVKADGTIDVAGGLHVNGVTDVQNAHGEGWSDPAQHGFAANRGLAGCAACHGADLAGGNTGVSCDGCHSGAGFADWRTNCTFCHGTRTASYTSADLAKAAPPAGSQGETAATSRAVGAHRQHLAGGLLGAPVACTECHATLPADLSHVTGTATLAFGAGARRGGAQPAWNGTTCASTYCHGGTLDAGGSSQEPRWTGGAAEAACGTCHGVPPPAPHTTSTACGGCHPGYTSTTVAVATHIDGTVQVVSVHGAGWRAKEQHGYAANREGLGGCKSCHGAALDGVGGSGPSCTSCHQAAGFASWATTCTFCHGDRTSGLASPPVDTQGRSVTTNVSVGNHASHLGTTLMTGMACTQCHPDRAGSNVIADSAHVDGNGVAEVSFGALARTGGASATYTRSSSTSASCSATYCHGSFTGGTSATVGWTSAVQVGCTSCHGAPPSTGKHGNHSGRSCGDCHPGYTRTSVNVATHLDGAREVGNLVKSWNPSTRTCVPCHVGSDTTW